MERIVPTIPGDLAVYYTYTPGQKGTREQPEFAPQISIQEVWFITSFYSEDPLSERYSEDTIKLYEKIWEKEIIG